MIETPELTESELEKQFLADGRHALGAEEREAAAIARAQAKHRRAFETPELSREEQMAVEERQEKAWLLFNSPKRRAVEQEKLLRRRRILHAQIECLLTQRALAVRDAQAAAEAVVMEDYTSRINALTAAFEAQEAERR